MIFIRFIFILTLFSNIGLYMYARQNTPKQERFIAVDSGVKKLMLLSELGEETTIWEGNEEVASTDEDVAKQEVFNQECYSVGAFYSKSEIRPVLDGLKNHVLKIRTREITSSQEAGYWVFIPAKQSREEALNIGRDLSRNNVRDYYVVTGGENENTISLGLYREKQNADDRLIELQNKGFNPQKQVRIEQWPEFWLDYTIASDQVSSLLDINELNNNIETNKVECNW